VVENGSKESFIDRENMHVHIHSNLLCPEMAWSFCGSDNLRNLHCGRNACGNIRGRINQFNDGKMEQEK
jgi:hypothetical protein